MATKKTTGDPFAVLSRPLQPDEVEWRIQSAKNNKTVVVPYITNRCVMTRFDEAFGGESWQNSFQEWRTKGVLCGIGVNTEKGWVWKYDGADESNIEPTKGGFSDSMKRTAVQWGIGRELYLYPRIFLEGEHRFLPRWAPRALENVVAQYNNGQLTREVYVLSERDSGGGTARQAPPKQQNGAAKEKPLCPPEKLSNAFNFVKNGGGTPKNVLLQLLNNFKLSEQQLQVYQEEFHWDATKREFAWKHETAAA